jgi:predicted NBD/HSP70 family sugar kinase
MSRTPGTPRLLRAINDRAALSLLLEHGPLSRVQLGALTGLSKPTASQLLSRLEEAGLVVQVGTSAGGRGPNAALYAVNSTAAYVAGLDVVAGRLTVAIADITGTVLAETAVPTEPGSETDPTVDVRTALSSAARRAGIRVRDLRSLTIGFPGAHDEVTDAVNYDDTLPNWARPGILGELRSKLGIRIELENDVNLAAIAERRYGGVAGIGSFALLWVSDGLGLAIDLGGELHRGATGGAGEIGYMPVPAPPARPDPTSQPIADFQDLVGAPEVLRLAAEHGIHAQTAAAAVRLAAEGADGGEALLGELSARLATGLATIVAVLDPELVVLTGSICRAGGEALAARVQRDLHEASPLRPAVTPSSIEGNPVLLGALARALEEAREEVFGTSDLTQLDRSASTPTPRTTARSEL